MKERPILFNAEMVKAIIKGRKTMTRRIVKMHHSKGCPWAYNKNDNSGYEWIEADPDFSGWDYRQPCRCINCPYSIPGDRLWVRETYYRYGFWKKNGLTEAGKQKWKFFARSPVVKYYDNPPDFIKPNSYRETAWYKRPSIFMPRWASRITLEITRVRVERLQEITEEDAAKEGLQDWYPDPKKPNGAPYMTNKRRFQDLWDSINGKKCPWNSNPWVWCISFRRVN